MCGILRKPWKRLQLVNPGKKALAKATMVGDVTGLAFEPYA